jgi:multiple sugar transport system ATP-binding protein
MAEVILQDVHKFYYPDHGPEVRAVEGINLEVKKGELMVLVGPSGCGKSTLLRMIAGLEDISGGTIKIGDQVVNEIPPKDRDVAMVFQNYALFPHMTVRENLAFGLKFRRVPREEINQRVTEAAHWLHLEEVLERKPKALSGGQRQRTALGRALVRRPRVFLLDEPLSNLDARMRAEMRAEIAKLHSRLRTTMIYVTHDQTEAMTLGERLCVMSQGRVMQLGAPLEIYQQPRHLFVAEFIGSPGMNLLKGKLAEERGRLVFCEPATGNIGIKITLEPDRFRQAAHQVGKEVILGIRSEEIAILPAAEAAPGNDLIEAKIEICEPMGHETLLHLSAGSYSVIARAGSSETFSSGQKVRLRFRLERVCLFDSQTQSRLA